MPSDWSNHAAKEDASSTVTLTAGQKYDIQLEHYYASDAGRFNLSWSSANQGKEIIPQEQLHPPSPARGWILRETWEGIAGTGAVIPPADGKSNLALLAHDTHVCWPTDQNGRKSPLW